MLDQTSTGVSPKTLRTYFEAVWDQVLVPLCGARNGDARLAFLHTKLEDPFPGSQYRFQGDLGFGGKLFTRSDLQCSVDCYREDDTPKRTAIRTAANAELAKLWAQQIEPALRKPG